MTDGLERYLHHSHQGWPAHDTQTPPSLTGEAMKRDDLFAGYEQGQRDMLAKCIAAVEAACHDKGHKPWGSLSTCINCHHGPLDALRALQEKP